MTRRFVVAAKLDRSEQEALMAFVKARHLAWWHWIDNVWLVTDRSDTLSAKEMRDELVALVPSVRCVVIEVGADAKWAGKGPKSGGKDMFKWLRNTWSRPTDKPDT